MIANIFARIRFRRETDTRPWRQFSALKLAENEEKHIIELSISTFDSGSCAMSSKMGFSNWNTSRRRTIWKKL